MNKRALSPAIAEINQTSRLTLTATPRKVGRTVTSVTISWDGFTRIHRGGWSHHHSRNATPGYIQ